MRAVRGRRILLGVTGGIAGYKAPFVARAADLVVVAPATADFLARAAHGRADDLLSACLLATSAPVLLVPAMNDRMWAHPAVARNVEQARALGYRVLDPDEG